jgi:hypothetical protein
MMDGVNWPEQTLTQIENEDWGEPEWQSYVVTNSHRLRHKPLREFTAEDLRFMLGQQISLPLLMPMALDVLELIDPFAGGDMNQGTLLYNALKVDRRFWEKYPRLWHRMNVVLVDLYSFRDFIEKDILPAAEKFKAMSDVIPHAEASPPDVAT